MGRLWFHWKMALGVAVLLVVSARPGWARLEASQVRPLSYGSTEILSRNQAVGPSFQRRLEFVQWIELESPNQQVNSDIGLTRSGELFHAIKIGKRAVARPLGGTDRFQTFFMRDGEELVAVDMAGFVHLYSPEQWGRSPVLALGRRLAMGWAMGTLASLLFVSTISLANSDALGYGGLMFGIGSLSALMSSLHFALARYTEFENSQPNGFRPTSIRFQDLKTLDQALASRVVTPTAKHWSDPSSVCRFLLTPMMPMHLIEESVP